MQSTILCDQSTHSLLASFVNTSIYQQLSHIQTISWYNLRKEEIKPCIGCFNCWIKTPGQCVMKDITTSINKDFINSDLVIYVTPLVYGSYSPTIKRALDHTIPNVLPFFRKLKGEVHHKQRYTKRPNLMMLAYNETITSQEKETFISLTKANAVNFDIPNPKIYFCTNETDIIQAITQIKSCLLKLSEGGSSK